MRRKSLWWHTLHLCLTCGDRPNVPSKSSTMAASTRGHRITVWRCDRGTSDGYPHLATSLGPQEQPEKNPSTALAWDRTAVLWNSQECHHTNKGHRFYSLKHLQDKSAWAGCLLQQQLHFSSLQNKAFPKCLLWLESACPFKTLVFSKGKKNTLCYLEFSMVTLCPEVTCPSKETFSIVHFFFILLFVSTGTGR